MLLTWLKLTFLKVPDLRLKVLEDIEDEFLWLQLEGNCKEKFRQITFLSFYHLNRRYVFNHKKKIIKLSLFHNFAKMGSDLKYQNSYAFKVETDTKPLYPSLEEGKFSEKLKFLKFELISFCRKCWRGANFSTFSNFKLGFFRHSTCYGKPKNSLNWLYSIIRGSHIMCMSLLPK